MISVLNFKPYNGQGSILGFFDLVYHSLTIKSCRLMAGKDGGSLWFSFPQQKENLGDEVKYHDQLFLSPPERQHITRLIILELTEQGHLEGHHKGQPKPKPKAKRPHITPEKEDLSEHYSRPGDDIAF